MQFGFVKGKAITDAIFIVRKMQQKYTGVRKEALFWLCGFGKSF